MESYLFAVLMKASSLWTFKIQLAKVHCEIRCHFGCQSKLHKTTDFSLRNFLHLVVYVRIKYNNSNTFDALVHLQACLIKWRGFCLKKKNVPDNARQVYHFYNAQHKCRDAFGQAILMNSESEGSKRKLFSENWKTGHYYRWKILD